MNFLKSLNNPKVTSYLAVNRMKIKRIFGVVIGLLVLFTEPKIEFDTFWEIVFDWTGYVLVAIACLGRVFASVFICGRKNDELSTQGPFSLVRNPLYVFSFLGLVGIGLLLGSLTLLVVLVLFFCTYYLIVLKDEEALLTKKFGKAYKDYQKEVPRCIPKKLKMDMPETVVVYPALLFQTMCDASLFFLVFPVVEALELLHETGALPTLFSLY